MAGTYEDRGWVSTAGDTCGPGRKRGVRGATPRRRTSPRGRAHGVKWTPHRGGERGGAREGVDKPPLLPRPVLGGTPTTSLPGCLCPIWGRSPPSPLAAVPVPHASALRRRNGASHSRHLWRPPFPPASAFGRGWRREVQLRPFAYAVDLPVAPLGVDGQGASPIDSNLQSCVYVDREPSPRARGDASRPGIRALGGIIPVRCSSVITRPRIGLRLGLSVRRLKAKALVACRRLRCRWRSLLRRRLLLLPLLPLRPPRPPWERYPGARISPPSMAGPRFDHSVGTPTCTSRESASYPSLTPSLATAPPYFPGVRLFPLLTAAAL